MARIFRVKRKGADSVGAHLASRLELFFREDVIGVDLDFG